MEWKNRGKRLHLSKFTINKQAKKPYRYRSGLLDPLGDTDSRVRSTLYKSIGLT